MSTVKFVPNPDKPHIKMRFCDFGSGVNYYLYPSKTHLSKESALATNYCIRINDGQYSTPGEAARALFNYRGEEK